LTAEEGVSTEDVVEEDSMEEEEEEVVMEEDLEDLVDKTDGLLPTNLLHN
jgi:hypothetical protein